MKETKTTPKTVGGSEPPPSPTIETVTEVSLNSVIGLSSPKTMKLFELIGDKEVVVMIDPGATHNFISLGTVKELGVEVMESGSFGVSFGNDEAIRVMAYAKGCCCTWKEELRYTKNSVILTLGVQWLEMYSG